MLNLSNAKKWNKATIHKAIITIFIIILLVCPRPTGKLREYTTSILGKITLIIATIAVICYDPIVGILAIILLLKCSGATNVGMNRNKQAGKEGFIGGDDDADDAADDAAADDGEKPTDSKRMQFINEHCTCKNMYNKDTGLLKPNTSYKDLCKRDKTDTPEKHYYLTGQLWNRIPNFAIDQLSGYSTKRSEEYKANKKEWIEQTEKDKTTKPYHLLIQDYGLIKLFFNSDLMGEMKDSTGDDKNTLSKLRFTGEPCNPCNLESCTNWELNDDTSSSSMGSFGGSSDKNDKKDKDEKKGSFGDKLAALFD